MGQELMKQEPVFARKGALRRGDQSTLNWFLLKEPPPTASIPLGRSTSSSLLFAVRWKAALWRSWRLGLTGGGTGLGELRGQLRRSPLDC